MLVVPLSSCIILSAIFSVWWLGASLSANTEPSDPYRVWIAGYSGLADVSIGGDPDHDGIPNGMEFVLGTDPSIPDPASISPTMELVAVGNGELVPSGSYLKFTWRRADRSAELSPEVEISANLGQWSPAEGGSAGIVVREYAEGYGVFLDRVEVYIPTSLAMNGRLFARLKLHLPEA